MSALTFVAQAAAVAADIVVVPDGPLFGQELAAGVLVVVVPGHLGGAAGGVSAAGGSGDGVLAASGAGDGVSAAGGAGGAAGGASAAVVVLVSEGPNGAAAVEVGAWIAVSRRCPLRLVPATGSRELVGLAFARAEELWSLWAARGSPNCSRFSRRAPGLRGGGRSSGRRIIGRGCDRHPSPNEQRRRLPGPAGARALNLPSGEGGI